MKNKTTKWGEEPEESYFLKNMESVLLIDFNMIASYQNDRIQPKFRTIVTFWSEMWIEQVFLGMFCTVLFQVRLHPVQSKHAIVDFLLNA